MSTRTSSRLQDKVYPIGNTNNSDPGESVDTSENYHEPARAQAGTKRKRQVVTRSQGGRVAKRRKGRLSPLTEFPLDVLFEIFAQLNPYDLLRLSRTTKSLRSILLHRSATTIWTSSLANIEDFPPVPDDMSVPAFVNLAFDPHCHLCGARNIQDVQWLIRMRVCLKCAKNHSTFPSFYDVSRSPRYTIVKSHSLAVTNFPSRIGSSRYGDTRVFYAPLLEVETSRFASIQDNPNALQALVEEFSACSVALNIHACRCQDWSESYAIAHQSELVRIRARRVEDVLGRLKALGWSDTIDKMAKYHQLSMLTKHKTVDVAKKLTDRGWKSIQAPLLEILEDRKKEYVLIEHKETVATRTSQAAAVIKEYLEALAFDTISPPLAAILVTKPFKDLIKQEPLVGAHPVDFTEALSSVPTFATEWRTTRDSTLVRLAQAEHPNLTASQLNLAKAVFRCSSCRQTMVYPRPVAHECSFCPSFWLRDLVDLVNARVVHFRFDNIEWDHTGSAKSIEMMVLHGLDPETTTIGTMTNLNPVAASDRLSSSKYSGYCQLQRWAPLMLPDTPTTPLRHVTEEEFEYLRSSPGFKPIPLATDHVVKCSVCNLYGPKSTIEPHMKTKHNRTSLSDNDFVLPALDHPMYRFVPIILPKKTGNPDVATTVQA